MKKIFYLIPLLVLGIFLSPNFSHAAILNQNDDSVVNPLAANNVIFQSFGFSGGSRSDVTDIYFEATAGVSLSGVGVHAIDNSGSWVNSSAWCSGGSSVFDTAADTITQIGTATNGLGVYQAHWNTPLNYSGDTNDCVGFYLQNGSLFSGPSGQFPDLGMSGAYSSPYRTPIFRDYGGTWTSSATSTLFYQVNTYVPPVANPTLTFLFPETGTTTPLFSNFLLSAANVTSSDKYYIQIKYYIPQVTGIKSISKTLYGNAIASSGIELAYDPFIIDSASTSSAVIANARLYDLTNFNPTHDISDYEVASTTSVFLVITPSLDTSVGTSTYLDTHINNIGGTLTPSSTPIVNPFGGMLIPVVGSSTYYCQSPNNLLDIGGGMAYAFCAAGKFFFVSSGGFSSYWDTSLQTFKEAFPFSVVFGIHDIINNVASSTASQNEQSVKVSLAGVSQFFSSSTPDIVFLSSSTLTNLVGQSNKDLIFGLEDAILWLMFCFGVYGMVAHGKKK